jgi:hypothetical protein
MSDTIEPLVVDLLEWIGRAPRPRTEVLEAWRTSCPRLPVWEEANARGFLDHLHSAERGEELIAVSESGRAYLAARRASTRAPS